MIEQTTACQAEPTPPSTLWWRFKRRVWRALSRPVEWVYYCFIHRRLMKLAHRFNWHHTRTCYPDHDTMHVCDWCGLRYVEPRIPAGYKPISSGSDKGPLS